MILYWYFAIHRKENKHKKYNQKPAVGSQGNSPGLPAAMPHTAPMHEVSGDAVLPQQHPVRNDPHELDARHIYPENAPAPTEFAVQHEIAYLR